MKFIPHEYQKYAIDRVVADPALGLFLEMGLGKTVITLTAINELRFHRWAVSRCLVVAPKKVAEATWSAEAAQWDHEAPAYQPGAGQRAEAHPGAEHPWGHLGHQS